MGKKEVGKEEREKDAWARWKKGKGERKKGWTDGWVNWPLKVREKEREVPK